MAFHTFGFHGVEAFSVLALTVSLSLARPRVWQLRIQPATAAVFGAVLSVTLGVVPLNLLSAALRILFAPVITIVSLMIITLSAERVGLVALLAERIAIGARGSGWRLFTLIFGCGTVTGMLFTNDAAVLIFTPLVFELVEQVRGPSWTIRNCIPFYFAVLYVANLVGALVTSNPINIVVASLFHIRFAEYALWMFVPAVASMAVSFGGLALVFQRSMPERFEIQPLPARSYRKSEVVACTVILIATLAGFFAESVTGAPTWLVASAGALVLIALQSSQTSRVVSLVRNVSWDVLLFVVGIFIVVLGLRRAGLTHEIGRLLSFFADHGTAAMTFGTSMLTAVCSALLDNHPTADMIGWAIRDLSLPSMATKTLAFAALIGGDLGPKMAPIGSLAALIWFRLLRDRGVDIPYSLYIRIGIPLTIAAIVAAALALNAELALAGHVL
jgi:arsenical pump membrane protein